ncbi:MAG: DUF2085 domain-containing protein, partial [Oscillospiraceae bacterium]|nr:DUF2085 domain-containing protein [Oscillospiraceae bacterium]
MKLGNALGCHQRPDRSFFYKGHQFPLCARCTGAVLGQFFAVVLRFAIKPNMILCVIFCGVLFLDWLIQYLE